MSKLRFPNAAALSATLSKSLPCVAAILAACVAGCGGQREKTGADAASVPGGAISASTQDAHAGSTTCRQCHERFHELWATSHHGLAMQPFIRRLVREKLTPQHNEIAIGEKSYRMELPAGESGGKCRMIERASAGEKEYSIEHVLGGKNVYYFLTPRSRGRLQVLPLAYDVRRREWYDTTASAVRHFGDRRDEALDWSERELTFNTSCYNCHVSQLSTNYDEKTDSYKTVWGEPGINCETCHGPAREHIRVCSEAAAKGETPADMKLRLVVQERGFSPHRVNAACAPCHAKMSPISDNFQPGDRYFDHFDLTAFEHPDFYPDGRDLGENYTYTLWRMNPCAKAGKLDCVHCHTSSGRYRHQDDPNQSCLPCHKERVKSAAAHSHHAADGPGSRCIACHMPMTEFARMRRSDHSFLPPTPAATLAFKSPNACNICHADKDAAWADGFVRQWHKDDYQTPVLHRAGLIEAARKQDWSRLPEIREYLKSSDREEITAAALLRLLESCTLGGADGEKLRAAMIDRLRHDPSPLVRAAAAGALGNNLDRPSLDALLAALGDDYRLVRIRAAASLAAVPPELVPAADRENCKKAFAEFETAMRVRPDDAASHYNLGNFYMARREYKKAVESFQRSTLLDPRGVLPLVNASLAYSSLGDGGKAEAVLRRALAVDPDCAAANFNLGLLLGELGRKAEAETSLRRAVKADPKLAAAAFNLGVILAESNPRESIQWCEKAVALSPRSTKYAYTLAFYQDRQGDETAAVETLIDAVKRDAADAAVYDLLASIYLKNEQKDKAVEVCRRAADDNTLPRKQRRRFDAMAERIK